MNVTDNAFPMLERYKLQPEIHSLSQFSNFIRYFAGKPMPAIHLKIETGMNRLGFKSDEIPRLKKLLVEHQNKIKVAGIFTHLASADNPEHEAYSLKQLKLFDQISTELMAELTEKPLRHALNTAGISSFPEHQFDLVRLGIGLYGYDPVNEDRLKVVSSLKTTVSQIKKIKEGETVGYGLSFKAKTDSTIATIAIGYADGFRRSLSNGVGKVLVNGQLVPVAGRVCMDMTMIDITGTEVKVGDEVTIFGEGLKIDTLATVMDTIPYEILTNVGNRVKRIFISE